MTASFSAWLNSPALTIWPLVAAIIMFPGGLIIFTIRHLMVGRVSTARVQQLGGSVVLSGFLMEFGLWLFRPVVTVGVKLKIHPDVFSWASLAISTIAGVAFGLGAFGLGGWLLIFGAMCDTLDGAVARARNMSSDSGEVLDAVIDRWAEMVVFFGLAWYYRNDVIGFICAVGACMGAIQVSYTRAKGESLGIDAKMGLMQRHERAFWVIMPTVCSAVYYAWRRPGVPHPEHWFVIMGLALIAVLANWTGLRRMSFIRRELRKR